MPTGESQFHISPPRGFEPVTLVAGSKQISSLDQWDMVRIMWDCRLSTELPPSSRLRRLWSQKGDLKQAWNRGGQKSGVRLSETVTLLAQGPSDSCWGRSPVDDQSRRGHQCSETMLTGESQSHISPPRGFEPVTLVAGSKQVSPLDQWDMVKACEIAGSAQIRVHIHLICSQYISLISF